MKTAKEMMEAIENGSVVITKIVRESIQGPHIWGRNAFEYNPLSRGFNRVKNNMELCLRDMKIAEDGVGKKNIQLHNSCFNVGNKRMIVPNTNNTKWWYVVFFNKK